MGIVIETFLGNMLTKLWEITMGKCWGAFIGKIFEKLDENGSRIFSKFFQVIFSNFLESDAEKFL